MIGFSSVMSTSVFLLISFVQPLSPPRGSAPQVNEDVMQLRHLLLEEINTENRNSSAVGILVREYFSVGDNYCGRIVSIENSDHGLAMNKKNYAFHHRRIDGRIDIESLIVGEEAIRPQGVCPPVDSLVSELEGKVLDALIAQGLLQGGTQAPVLAEFDAHRLVEAAYAEAAGVATYQYRLLSYCGTYSGDYTVAYDPMHLSLGEVELSAPHLSDLDAECVGATASR